MTELCYMISLYSIVSLVIIIKSSGLWASVENVMAENKVMQSRQNSGKRLHNSFKEEQ